MRSKVNIFIFPQKYFVSHRSTHHFLSVITTFPYHQCKAKKLHGGLNNHSLCEKMKKHDASLEISYLFNRVLKFFNEVAHFPKFSLSCLKPVTSLSASEPKSS